MNCYFDDDLRSSWMLDQDEGKFNVCEFVLQSELYQNACLVLIIGLHVAMASMLLECLPGFENYFVF